MECEGKPQLFGKKYLKVKESAGMSTGVAQTRTQSEEAHHTDKWRRCVDDVTQKSPDANAYAVCTAQLGPSTEARKPKLFGHRFREAVSQKLHERLNAIIMKAPQIPGHSPMELDHWNEDRATIRYRYKDGDGEQHYNDDDFQSFATKIIQKWVKSNKIKMSNLMFSRDTVGGYQITAVIRLGAQKQQGLSILATLGQAKMRESEKKNSRGSLKSTGRFVETIGGQAQTGRRFRVVLLQEGLGNLDDCFYYTAQAIESAVPVFEGAQFFVNHPAQSEETDRPERDVRDIAGYFENLSTQRSNDGRNQLVGDLVLVDSESFDRERALMVESIEYAQKHQGKDLVGLSINASGNFEEATLQDFIQKYEVPTGAKAKIQEALQKGIQVIRPVQEMTSAVSCDLVTVAGAGGRINKILEGERTMSENEKKEMEKKESDKKESEKKENEAQKESDGEKDGQGADGMSGDHQDADQDEELIKSMLKKYLGDGFSDEDHAMAKEAIQMGKEMYPENEQEAMKCAGYNMKMAKHMQAKMKQDEAQPAPQQAPQEAGAKTPVGDAGAVPKKDQVSESDRGLRDQVVRLTGENARLKNELETLKLSDFVEKMLKESHLPMVATKKFRETIKGIKSQKEITDKFEIFREAYTAGSMADGLGFVVNAEKTLELSETGSGGDFSDCVELD